MAWEEGRLLGCGGHAPVASPPGNCTPWPSAARRGEGIGAALVAALEREVAARGC